MDCGTQACRSLAGFTKPMFSRDGITGLHVWKKRKASLQDAQKVRSARPQRVKTGGVAFSPAPPRAVEQLFSRVGYVEDLNDARTKLADFFSIRLGFGFAVIQMPMLPVEPGMAQFVGENVPPPRQR